MILYQLIIVIPNRLIVGPAWRNFISAVIVRISSINIPIHLPALFQLARLIGFGDHRIVGANAPPHTAIIFTDTFTYRSMGALRSKRTRTVATAILLYVQATLSEVIIAQTSLRRIFQISQQASAIRTTSRNRRGVKAGNFSKQTIHIGSIHQMLDRTIRLFDTCPTYNKRYPDARLIRSTFSSRTIKR